MNKDGTAVLNGIDNLIAGRAHYARYKKIGLVSNSRAVTRDFKINLHALTDAGFEVRFIFSPEHGYFANVRDGDYIGDAAHPDLKIPILSLFTEGHSRNAITEALAADPVDAIIFDIQDAGVRFYTYIHALGLALAASEALGIPVLVLDRINPIGCDIAEGSVPDPDYISELCPFNIPLRYSLSIGELAGYLAGSVYKKAALTVVKISGGYRRDMIFAQSGLEWNPPSPAMVSSNTALFYPGTCLFEGTNLSEGRGTKAPFQTIGSPFFKPEAVIDAFYSGLAANNIKDFEYISMEPAEFTPASSKYENTACRGLYIAFKKDEPRSFRALLFGILLLKAVYDVNRENMEFLFSEKSRKFFIDRLCGGPDLRKTIIDGDIFQIYRLYGGWAETCREFSRESSFAKIY